MRLRDNYDSLLVDLDGTVYRGTEVIPHAREALRDDGPSVLFTTNNSWRTAEMVCDRLRGMGFDVVPEQVVSSSQALPSVLDGRIPRGSSVLVIGTGALQEILLRQGFRIVESADDHPAAVVQGHAPNCTWQMLCEADLSIRDGALWVATNTDANIPDERGMIPGSGSLVAAVATATGQEPLVAGKPHAPIFNLALSRLSAKKPLVIGDLLTSDIQGARGIGADSLLVLTGVSGVIQVLNARSDQRPMFIAADLRALDSAPSDSIIIRHERESRQEFNFDLEGTELILRSTDSSPSLLSIPTADDASRVMRDLIAQVWSVRDSHVGGAQGNALSDIERIVDADRWARHIIEYWGLGSA